MIGAAYEGQNNVYLRTGDVIQANMAQLTENDKFDLSKSYTHYTLKANTKVNTMWSRFTDALGIWGLMDSDGWKSTSITTSRGY